MTHKRSKKETQHLRELMGADGQKAHYFNPASPAEARQYRERRSAKQVAEMRQAAGGSLSASGKQPAAREKLNAAAQVIAMRRAAGKK